MDELLGIPVRVNPALVGSKTAVLLDDELFVSPAMHSLIVGAKDEAELRFLFENIQVTKIKGGCFNEPDYRCFLRRISF